MVGSICKRGICWFRGTLPKAQYCPSQQTSPEIVEELIKVRRNHPAWGSRKLKRYLENQGARNLPATSTITDILRRAGLIELAATEDRKRWQRFEHQAPNHLWQMDFKGDFVIETGRCYPLTVLDDHSRFAVGLKACSDQKGATVHERLINIFANYGMPERINTDNGSPWGNSCGARYTQFSVWLLRLGIKVSHSRPCHPQTNGKDERFHRTLKTELLQYHYFKNWEHAQQEFDKWRDCYNLERPHEGIDMETPITRYRPSFREYTGRLSLPEYDTEYKVRKVNKDGVISFMGNYWLVGSAFSGFPVGIRPGESDGKFMVYFCHQKVAEIDLRSANGDK